jgi:hypothetical protein
VEDGILTARARRAAQLSAARNDILALELEILVVTQAAAAFVIRPTAGRHWLHV